MPGAGRPRRYEAADELRLLFDAAFAAMRENGFEAMTVADILRRAGVSTRAFYRHFASKDELLCAMYRREAERAAERLEAAVAGARSPVEALEAWVDHILSLGHDRRKAAKAAVLGAPGAARAAGYGDEVRHALKLLAGPLEEILAEGHRDGSFPAADPVADAPLLQAVVWGAAGLNPYRSTGASRAEARAAALSFCLRALGAPQ